MLHYTFENLKCTRKFFLNRLVTVIKSPKINGRYLSILVQISTKDNDIVDIGTYFCVDRLNLNSIRLYKFYFNLRYNEQVIDNNNEISSLIISFEEIDKDAYTKYIANLYRDEN